METTSQETNETNSKKKSSEFLKKTGRLSKTDKAYIIAHARDLSPQDIALHVNKDIKTVRRFILENCHTAPVGEEIDEDELQFLKARADFKNTPEWKYLKEEFDTDEVRFFEHRYVKHIQQFKEDITPTEETQIFNLIKFEIMLHRNRKRTMRAIADMERMQKGIDKIYKSCDNDLAKLTDAQRSFLESMERHLASYREAQHASIKEYTELQTKHAGILKDLKATREQRLQRLESNTSTFVELIKKLQDEEFRDIKGREELIIEKAVEKEAKRLGGVHRYLDGKIDQPLLNADTV